jgi:CheY-like chemotaxis protein
MQKAVLVVEDEFLIAMDLTQILEANGWRIIGPAPSVQAALGLLEGELPSVAVLDMNLRNQLVTPVAEALKRLGVPFVLASAYSMLQIEQVGGDVFSGAPVVGKPTDEDALLAALAKLT